MGLATLKISSGSMEASWLEWFENPPDNRKTPLLRTSHPKDILDMFIVPTSFTKRLVVRVFLKGHFVKKNVHPTTQLVSTQEDHIQKERLNKQV